MVYELVVIAFMAKQSHVFVAPRKYWGYQDCASQIGDLADDLKPKKGVDFRVVCRQVKFRKMNVEENIIK
jgi:hypothetical protein